jgi:enoyl-CoA hydratase/carnithine racemase
MKAQVVATLEDGVGKVRINRPEKKNAIDSATARALRDAVETFGATADCIGVLICGAGGDLSSGADLSESAGASAALRWRDTPAAAMLRAVRASAVPVAAVIDGWAAGLGMGIAGAATFAVAGVGSRFYLPESKLGFFPFGVAPYVTRRVRPERVLEWSLSGEPLSLAEARAAGLVTHQAEAGDAEHVGRALLVRFRAAGPAVIRQGAAWVRQCDPGYRDELAADWNGEQLDAALARRHKPALRTAADQKG